MSECAKADIEMGQLLNTKENLLSCHPSCWDAARVSNKEVSQSIVGSSLQCQPPTSGWFGVPIQLSKMVSRLV